MPDTYEGIIMKHRFFLLILAAFMATSAWAQAMWPERAVDTIPVPVYITDIQFNPSTNQLSFVDNFQNDFARVRMYNISLEYRTENSHIWQMALGNPTHFIYTEYYDYGIEHNRNFTSGLIDHNNYFYSNEATAGGFCQFDISNLVAIAYKKGYVDVRIIVRGCYKYANTWRDYYLIDSNPASETWYIINYLDTTLPKIQTLNISAPSEVKYGEQLLIEGTIKAVNKVNYKIQESYDYVYDTENYTWQTLKSGTLSTVEAREGKTVQYKRVFTGNGVERIRLYRLIVTDVASGVSDTSQVEQVDYKYSWVFNDGASAYYGEGEKITLPKPADCHEYSWSSEWPIGYGLHGDFIEYSMPACNVWFYDKPKKYTVKFLNADYTLLKTVEVDCGSDAGEVAPTPTMGNYTFIGWNKDLTNVHSSFSAVAKYDIGNEYYLNVNMTNHKNEVFPFAGFVDNETRAMVGDKITLRSSVFATTPATLYYETAPWNNTEQRFLWDPNSGKKVADYTNPNQERFFDQEITIAYDANTQFIHPFEYKTGVRFYLMIAGVKVYSDPIEIDIYYPMTINSLSGEEIYAENTAGDHIQSLSAMLPARNDDTVRVYGNNGADGGCLSFARVLYPSRPLDSGLDEEGNAYVIAPGEKETLNVDVAKVAVVFDGAAPSTNYDFTSQGVGYKGNAYYAEVVNCGGAIQNIPADPANGQQTLFIGWEAWGDYADNAYLNVPATGDSYIGFTAKWEDIPEAPTYTVIFFDKDGNILSTQEVKEGENAVPPVAPEVAGYHFVGWDSPYTTITNDKDITAVYGEDSKTWTVTYLNWDNSPLGTELVNDGEAAKGVIATRTGYTFVGWSEDISSVKSDMTVTALFDVSVFTITYTIDGVKIMSEQVAYGAMPAAYQSVEDQGKPATEQYVYTFSHWTPAIVPAVADATYEAVFTPSLRKYLVTFQNWDHSFLAEQQVEYGKAATAPANPTREGYTFKGWDREFNHIIADMTVTALFEKSKGQGIENTASPSWGESERGCKLLLDGNLYIIRPDGILYNAQGAKVK